jgi:tetratricopeptide (TPR) repeat protein
MSCKDFLGQGWKDHGDDAEGVFDRLPQGFDLIESPDDALGLSALVVHVAGEHLGRWSEGLGLLARLLDHDSCAEHPAARAALNRARAVLHHCDGNGAERDACMADGLDGERPEASSAIRVWAIAASALAGQGRIDDAAEAFRRAVELADYGPCAEDPAARALAITSNNLACELELKAGRSFIEDELLREASFGSRRFWEVSGTWVNVERAEYRLARTHVELGEPEAALTHARLCLEICESNGAEAIEFLFAHEARARALHAGGQPEEARQARDEAGRQLKGVEDEGLRDFCKGELDKLDAVLAGT